jgi:hypothetical protein
MVLIRAALGHGRNLHSTGSAVFRLVGLREDFYFADRFSESIWPLLHVSMADAVHHDIVLALDDF